MSKYATVRIKINRKGIRRLMRGPEAIEDLKIRSGNIEIAAGEGFKSETKAMKNRAHATVWTGTPEAKEAEAKERKLTKAIDAGRRR